MVQQQEDRELGGSMVLLKSGSLAFHGVFIGFFIGFTQRLIGFPFFFKMGLLLRFSMGFGRGFGSLGFSGGSLGLLMFVLFTPDSRGFSGR